jgi:hypothetical protein
MNEENERLERMNARMKSQLTDALSEIAMLRRALMAIVNISDMARTGETRNPALPDGPPVD